MNFGNAAGGVPKTNNLYQMFGTIKAINDAIRAAHNNLASQGIV